MRLGRVLGVVLHPGHVARAVGEDDPVRLLAAQGCAQGVAAVPGAQVAGLVVGRTGAAAGDRVHGRRVAAEGGGEGGADQAAADDGDVA